MDWWCRMTQYEMYGTVVVVLGIVTTEVSCRECYNYKEDPSVLQCSTGCCGEKYNEYCCNATMQIVGSILGGVVVLSAIIALAYYCYRKKSKRRQMTGQPGLFGRIGFRTRNNHLHQTNQAQHRTGPPVQVPRGRPFRIPTNSGPPPPINANTYYNPTYNPGQHHHVTSAPFYDGNTPPTAPSAPLPPPYDINLAPPPYSANTKQVPPPPEYTAVIGHYNMKGYKQDGFSDGMTPPSH